MIPFSICLHLSYFPWHNTSKVHPCGHSGRISFFLMAEYYSMCVYTTFSEGLFLFENGQLGH